MKVKHILTLFILGLICVILGALFKVLHWMYGPQLLTIGTVLQVISGVLVIWKLFSTKRFRDILDK